MRRSGIILERGISERGTSLHSENPWKKWMQANPTLIIFPAAAGAIHWSRSATQGNSTEMHINLLGHFGAWNDNLLVRSRKGAGPYSHIGGNSGNDRGKRLKSWRAWFMGEALTCALRAEIIAGGGGREDHNAWPSPGLILSGLGSPWILKQKNKQLKDWILLDS